MKSIFSLKGALSILFLLASSFATHFYFLQSDSYFTVNADALHQMAVFQKFLAENFRNGNFMWSWNYGIGGDLFGEFGYYYSTSLFFWISVLFNFDTIFDTVQLKLGFSILKSFCSMFIMFILLKYLKRSYVASVVGALMYGGSIFFLKHSLLWDFMVDSMVWLPLMILGFERWLKEKKWGLFIAGLFFMLSTNFYFAFKSSVFLMIYAIFAFLGTKQDFTVKSILRFFIGWGKFYLLAFGLAAAAFIPSIYALFHTDRGGKVNDIPLTFAPEYYAGILEKTFNLDGTYSILGLPVALLFLYIAGYTFLNRREKSFLYMSLFMYFLYFVPFAHSFFNGLSEMQIRWVYLLVFSVSITSAFLIDRVAENKEKIMTSKAVIPFLVLIFGLFAPIYKDGAAFTAYEWLAFCLTVLCFIVLLLAGKLGKKAFYLLITAILAVNTFGTQAYFSKKSLGSFYGQDRIDSSVLSRPGLENKAELDMIRSIQTSDSGFYRIINDGNNYHNAPMYQDYHGAGTYSSLLNGKLQYFLKQHHNVLFDRDSINKFNHFNNRFYLESYMGIKYHIVPRNADAPIAGAKMINQNETLKVYENLYALPIAFMQTEYASKEDVEDLSFIDRDELLLQAVYTDKPVKVLDWEKYNVSDLNSERIDRPEQLIAENVEQNGDVWKVHENGTVTIPIEKRQDGQVLIEADLKSAQGNRFDMEVEGIRTQKVPVKDKYAYPAKGFVFNLSPSFNKDSVTIKLSPGEYQVSSIKIYHQKMDTERVKQLQKQSLTNIQYDKNKVSGEIKVTEDGMLTASIPYSRGWKTFVNGEEAETYTVNQVFAGTPLKKGTYKIEFVYTTPLLKESLMVSITALFITIFALFRSKRRKD
ncbi:YfhO family protein [Bacillus mangrovi]|uniref:YfhO family protein n=1 Tax=Metabacillus mangrovi TaxID=1491830 RepID=A0A7X2S758_9BACI|nr:YfhO family protein [Metabacillus mangrovi]MTH54888.1 YfhO family protein [Metabacillus mangrovi]